MAGKIGRSGGMIASAFATCILTLLAPATLWASGESSAVPALVQAIQLEIDAEARGIAKAYFIEVGEKTAPRDIGFRSEVFLKDGPGGVPEIERVLMTGYVPEFYPDGMILDFRKNFRRHFEEQGYAVVFGPDPMPDPAVASTITRSPAIFDLRFRRIPPPWLDAEGGAGRDIANAPSAQPRRAMIEIFGGRINLDGIKSTLTPLRDRLASFFDGLGATELSVVAGAGAAMAFVILVMIALAPLRILRRRQAAQARYRQYPATARARAVLPPAGEPPLFKSGYREVVEPKVDPQVEAIRATMAQMGIKEVLEILRGLEPRYRDQILQGLNVHKSIKARIEKALASVE